MDADLVIAIGAVVIAVLRELQLRRDVHLRHVGERRTRAEDPPEE